MMVFIENRLRSQEKNLYLSKLCCQKKVYLISKKIIGKFQRMADKRKISHFLKLRGRFIFAHNYGGPN